VPTERFVVAVSCLPGHQQENVRPIVVIDNQNIERFSSGRRRCNSESLKKSSPPARCGLIQSALARTIFLEESH